MLKWISYAKKSHSVKKRKDDIAFINLMILFKYYKI